MECVNAHEVLPLFYISSSCANHRKPTNISFRQKQGKNIVLHFQLTLPVKTKGVTYNNPRRNYVTAYFGLTLKLAKKLKNVAKKEKITESEVIRGFLDKYLSKMENRKLEYKPFKSTKVLGLRTLPRTIHKEQDKRLRALSEKTGRSISELVRESLKNI